MRTFQPVVILTLNVKHVISFNLDFNKKLIYIKILNDKLLFPAMTSQMNSICYLWANPFVVRQQRLKDVKVLCQYNPRHDKGLLTSICDLASANHIYGGVIT